MITKEQKLAILDKVITALQKQGRYAMRGEGMDRACCYRAGGDPTGDRCAIGVLIADEHYTPRCEGGTTTNAWCSDKGKALCSSLVASGIDMDVDGMAAFLDKLQTIHDRNGLRDRPFAVMLAEMEALRQEITNS